MKNTGKMMFATATLALALAAPAQVKIGEHRAKGYLQIQIDNPQPGSFLFLAVGSERLNARLPFGAQLLVRPELVLVLGPVQGPKAVFRLPLELAASLYIQAFVLQSKGGINLHGSNALELKPGSRGFVGGPDWWVTASYLVWRGGW